MKLSNLFENIRPAKSIEINQKVYDLKRQGKDIITLSLGEAFFDLPHLPFEYGHYENGFHYSDTVGIPELRKKIAEYYNSNYRCSVSADQIVVSCGSKPLTLFGMASTLNSGDNVILHEPAWLSYQDQATIIGANVRFIPFQKSVKTIEKYIDNKTKLIILNNPNNPSGFCYSYKEIEDTYKVCNDLDITLLVDEAYSDFVSNEEFVSLAKIDSSLKHGIVVNSLSKNFGMSGFRLGYAITNPDMLRSITTLNQHTVTCAPTILQNYITTHFDEFLNITLPQIAKIIEKRDELAKYMDEIGLCSMNGKSTFYFMVNIGNYRGCCETFANELLSEYQIAVVPGTAYGPNLTRYIRLGIGSESVERIMQALFIIKAKTNEL